MRFFLHVDIYISVRVSKLLDSIDILNLIFDIHENIQRVLICMSNNFNFHPVIYSISRLMASGK